ncbi:protease HtpX [Candidatus Pantoea carbekii]|uniref:protease HtpX n=1 Tax=Candidatus Pantoea carbekii TaxID=1235990 RepID=UPI0006187D79|nr:protease HtpX [Candidatus Pantoea carbekii]AKC32048.1 protease HtpX HtpX [Candidatus Pantoea carbekii]
MNRIFLFLITHLSVMLVFGLFLNLIGIQSNNIQNLLIISSCLGFSGSFISLLLSKSMALRAVNGVIIEYAHDESEHWLIKTVSCQAKQTGIKMPQLAIYQAKNINAFSTGFRRNSSLIAVSSGLLKHMNYDETEAVIAHEISHIANGDMVTMGLIQGIVNTFVIFFAGLMVKKITFSPVSIRCNSAIENDARIKSLGYIIVTIILELIFGMLATMIVMWFSRHREFYADAHAAKLVGSKKMIAALQRLNISSEPPQEPQNIIVFCINGKKTKSIFECFMSHPALKKRIKTLLRSKDMD